jgi:hypothetical protein
MRHIYRSALATADRIVHSVFVATERLLGDSFGVVAGSA